MNEASQPNRYGLTTQVLALAANYKKTIFVPSKNFTIAQLPTPGVTALKDVVFEIDKSNCDDCLDYTFATMEPHRTDGWHAFTFVKPVSTQERYTPVLPPYHTNEEVTWDAVLYGQPVFFIDEEFPLAASSFNNDTGKFGQVKRGRIYTQDVYLDAQTVSSDVRILVYISDKPFSKSWLLRPQPQPTRVNWNFGASSGDYGRCLHGDVVVPAQKLDYQVLYNGDATSSSANAGVLGEQRFHATNFKKRAPYEKITVEQSEGLFIAYRKQYTPPPHQLPSKIAA